MKTMIKSENKVNKRECPIPLKLILKRAHVTLFLQYLRIRYFLQFKQPTLQLNFLSSGFSVCARNEESFTVVTSEQPFENYQINTALSKEGMY